MTEAKQTIPGGDPHLLRRYPDDIEDVDFTGCDVCEKREVACAAALCAHTLIEMLC
jgi:hypothetical protein